MKLVARRKRQPKVLWERPAIWANITWYDVPSFRATTPDEVAVVFTSDIPGDLGFAIHGTPKQFEHLRAVIDSLLKASEKKDGQAKAEEAPTQVHPEAPT